MSQEIEKEDGTKETVYTADEYNAKETELGTVRTELTELQRVNAARAQDFTAYSKLSEEEKKAYDVNTTNLLKQQEILENKISALSTSLSDKEKKESESVRTTALTSIHHGDETTKKLVEEKYALLSGMPESTPQEVTARAREAAKLAGIQIDPRNPLYSSVNGEAPNYKPNKEYVDTPEGQAALQAVLANIGFGNK